MMRKHFLSFALAAVTALPLAAQQRPNYTQYILNNYVLNPALTGIENYTDVKISHRHQWVGFNGRPVTTYLTAHGPIGKKDYRTNATSFRVPGENPRGKSYWEDYSAAEPHHGVGLTVLSDKTGSFNRFEAQGTYAYHIGIAPKTSLSAGVGVGIQSISLDRGKTLPADPNDPALGGNVNNLLNRIKPDVSLGVWLYSDRYFAGISAQQLVPFKTVFADIDTLRNRGKLIPHLFATAGYKFFLNDDITVIPSVMYKYVPNTPTSQFDVNVKMQYQDLIWVGASFRNQFGYAGMVGINVSNTFNVGYAYDYTTTKINTFSSGTHEVILGFLLGNKYGDWCPRNVW
jgi:type IX secretion system PorP/SprF family membrane protein